MPHLSRTSLSLSLLLLLGAVSLTADEPVRVLPAGPTTDTPVTLRLDVWCNPIERHTTTINGKSIRVDVVVPSASCPSPPLPFPYDVKLGLLPSGEYTVDVHIFDTKHTKTFIVRNATPGAVDIRPFAVPTEPFGSRLRAIYPWGCAGENCRDVTVTVGGVVLPPGSIRGGYDSAIWFDAPPHEPGFVDVSITAYGDTYTSKNALYYYDRTKPPDPSLWERVLFPVLFNSKGAHGSEWVSEAAIANPARWFVENFNRIDGEPCIDWGCSQLLGPASFFAFGGAGHGDGIALLVSRAEVEDIALSLRIRDVARQAEGFGTEVPVVREKKMAADASLTLLDVPVDPRYRTKLRIYAFEEHTHGAYVEVQRGNTFSGSPVVLRRSCSGVDCAAAPWYGELDLPAGEPGERVNLYVRAGGPDALSWAFASVTNNDTQQVTIVTPDGAGGSPCAPCEVK